MNDGHLIFQTARNKNITFNSTGEGSIMVNGEDLSRIANLGRTSLAEMQKISTSQWAQMTQTVAQLQQQYNTMSNTLATFQQERTTITEQFKSGLLTLLIIIGLIGSKTFLLLFEISLTITLPKQKHNPTQPKPCCLGLG